MADTQIHREIQWERYKTRVNIGSVFTRWRNLIECLVSDDRQVATRLFHKRHLKSENETTFSISPPAFKKPKSDHSVFVSKAFSVKEAFSVDMLIFLFKKAKKVHMQSPSLFFI